jgi:hypothetical protein
MPSQNLSWSECLGRDGWDNPLNIPENMAQEAVNVTVSSGQLCAKRPGSAAVTLTGDAFTGYNRVFRFIPAQDETVAELWIVSTDGTTKILRVPIAAAVNLTLKDPVTGHPTEISAAALNGKFYLAYQSGVNRLHVYNPAESTTDVRRAGLPAPAAPGVADTGGGSYAAIPRFYAIAWQRIVGGVTVSQSNMSAATAFTPSGSGAAARVTKPAAASEGETHWVVFASASSANGPFYQLAQVAVATTTYDDSAAPSSYATNPASPVIGSNYPFPSVKYLVSDGNRLLGLGVWETTAGDSVAPVPGRVYVTPVLGSTNPALGDDERFQNTLAQSDWISLNINGGGIDRGLSGPINNVVYAFQSAGIYALIPTGSATIPYRRFVLTRVHGSVSNQSQVVGEDANGAPAVYFLSPLDGPRRITLGSQIEWLGKDVTDIWATVNLSASIPAHGIYDQARKQVIWWIATGNSDTPDTMIVFNVTLGVSDGQSARRGWTKWTGPLAAARCSVSFSSTLASSRPVSLVPYRGDATTLARQDGTSNQDFGAVSYQAYVRSKAFNITSQLRRERVLEAFLTAKAQAATTIRQTLTKDWGTETKTADISIAPAGSETYVRPRGDDSDFSDNIVVDIQLGDASAANSTFTLVRWDSTAEILTGAP